MLIVTTDCWMWWCMKTNGVNILGSHHWHCVCESSLGSETLWIHAGSQGAILDQSIWQFGRVHSGSCCLPYMPLLSAQHRAGQSRNRPTPVRLKQWIWRWYSVWWGHQRVSDENAQGLSPLISSLVLPQLSMQLCWWETHKIQSTQTHTQSWDTTDRHIPTTPLSDCLSSSSLVPLPASRRNATRIQWHQLPCVEGGCYPRGMKPRLVSIGHCVWEHPYERWWERNAERNGKKRGTKAASIAK